MQKSDFKNLIIQINRKSLLLLSPGIIAACLGCLLLFYPWIIGDKSMIWGGDFDNNLIFWNFAWAYHVLFERWDWLNFWNANSFYPHVNTLAFSDSLISGQFFYAPLVFTGLSPLLSMHLTLIGFCFLGCILTDYGLRKIPFNWIERFILIYISHFGLTMIGFLPGHLQFFGFQLAPSFFIFLYLYLKKLEPIYGYWVTAVFFTAVLFSTYFAPMAFAVAMPYTLWMLFCHLRKSGYQAVFKKILDPKFSIPVISLLIVLYFIQLRPYTKFQQDFQKPSAEEVELYSAKTLSIFHLSSNYSRWYANKGYANGEWEYAYFPGYLSMFCAMLMVYYYFLKKNVSNEFWGMDIRFIGFVIYVFFISWMLSLGPLIDIDNYKMIGPYSLVNFLFPPFGSVRAPGRFGMFFGVFFAISILFTLRLIKNWKFKYTNEFALIFIVLIIVENLPRTQTYSFHISEKDIYEKISGLLSPGESLLVLPIAGANHMDTCRNLMEHLKGSTIHWARIPSGYGSKSTPELQQFIHLDNMLKKDSCAMNQIYSFCEKNRVSNILIFLDRYPKDIAEKIKECIHKNNQIIYKNESNNAYLITNMK